ncbi:MAG: Dyp-type peroxidase [Aliivibrio sp.]|uniref:Dyp-type peroxidase n=1 Tax=Aliivibrio sp. TaxID=1872443 RepID=UPI001A4D8115|nr:Dyp-type peroxidase [Aliivibrio sp.]
MSFSSQSAILPNAGSFALYVTFNVKNAEQHVLQQLQLIPSLVDDLNKQQDGANLNVAISFSYSMWEKMDQAMPDELKEFTPLGSGDITAPATGGDILLHIHSNRHDLHFYILRKLLLLCEGNLEVVDETYGYRYLDSRDMTDFIDGTENPKDEGRSEVAIIHDGNFAGGSYVMVQRFIHNLPAWNRLSVAAQEKVIGRTKPDSIELDDVPKASHVGRVDIKEEGKGVKILRHSLPYGSVSGEHGLLFIAYCNRVHNFKVMLESMYGETDGHSDQMLKFTTAVTGAYFFTPSVEMLNILKLSA